MLVFVALWTIPTLGLLVSSLRDKDQIIASGWWTALSSSSQTEAGRAAGRRRRRSRRTASSSSRATSSATAPGAQHQRLRRSSRPRRPSIAAGATADLGDGVTLHRQRGRHLRHGLADKPSRATRGQRVYYAAVGAAALHHSTTTRRCCSREGIGRSFINSLTVTIPATIIPILIAAFAAYALAWMRFPGRALLIAVVVGLLVVPLQMSLIPLLQALQRHRRLLRRAGQDLSRHLAGAYRLRPAASPSTCCATTWPACRARSWNRRASTAPATSRSSSRSCCRCRFPALASFAIFQFLWVWNDLLVAMVFLGSGSDQLVLTGKLNALLGSRGGNWEILTTSAFITIIVPLIVFFSLQRYFVRGLLAGSVKGG